MDKLAVLLVSGDLEKIQAGAMIASVAAQMEREVTVFVSMDALLAFKKEIVESKKFKTSGEVGKAIIEKNAPSFVELLRMSREMGNIKIFACSMVLDMFNLKLEDLVDIFDKQMGVAAFVNKTEDSQVMVF